jgi:hypothetical protein
LFIRDNGLWDVDDDKKINPLVEEMSKRKEHDYTKLLLDTLPRAVLGYNFSIENVKNTLKSYTNAKLLVTAIFRYASAFPFHV